MPAPPKADVGRRFRDRDPVGRVAGQILERNLDSAIARDGAFDRTMQAAVKDLLLGGQGAAWVRYDVQFSTAEVQGDAPDDDDDGNEAGEADGFGAGAGLDASPPGLPLSGPPASPAASDGALAAGPGADGAGAAAPAAGGPPGAGLVPAPMGLPLLQPAASSVPVASMEAVLLDFVHRDDFGFTAGSRVWDEVQEAWRRSFLTRDACIKRFGAELGGRIPLDCKQDGDDEGVFAKATIYEIWCCTDRTTRWLHMGMDELLDERPYPLKISGRFPCPAPLFGTMTNGGTVPVPDYVQYQDQAQELDDLTGRIHALTKALELKGFVPGDLAAEVQKALDISGEGKLVPIEGWSAFQGQKFSDVIVWFPMEALANALTVLVGLRDKVKADAYEITGVSDILRGQGDAAETATAQGLKAQWGGIRVRQRQAAVQRFAAEALGIIAEVLVGHFDPERLATVAGRGLHAARRPGVGDPGAGVAEGR